MNDWYRNYLNGKIEKEASLKEGVMISIISFLSGVGLWFEAKQLTNFLDSKNVSHEQFAETINNINHTNKNIEEIDKSDIILAKDNIDNIENIENNNESPVVETKNDDLVNIDKLIDALQDVESNNNPNAIGDNGNAYGILQIWKPVIQDVNRVYNTNYTHKDAFNPQKSRDIAKKYLNHYGNIYTRNKKQNPDYETLARIWNGGPTGYSKPSTNDYWNKVKGRLQ